MSNDRGMLSIKRKSGESVTINTQDGMIDIFIGKLTSTGVQLCFRAPRSIAINRTEKNIFKETDKHKKRMDALAVAVANERKDDA